MNSFSTRAHLRTVGLLPLVVGFVGAHYFGAQDKVDVTELGPNLCVFATAAGNVIASTGADGAFLVGLPSAAITAQIASFLEAKRAPRSATW